MEVVENIDLRSLIYMISAIMLAAMVAFTSTPAVSVLAYKIGAIDVPKDDRRMHKKPTPRMGGLAIFAGFVVASFVFCKITPELIAIYVGGLIIVAVGMLDDVFRINAWIKLLAQIGVALIAISQGIVIERMYIFERWIEFGSLAIPITVLWIVGLTNAINLIDGLDGLACGVSAISCVSLLLVMLLNGEYGFAMITAAVAGSCLGFLPFNFNPAKIFMGDTGALFLGYTMAVLSVGGLFKFHTLMAFLVPLSIFGFPLVDTAFAFTRRILKGKSPFSPDRGHLHHRLIDMGFTQKQSVWTLYAICAILGTSAVVITGEEMEKALVIIAVGIGIFLVNFYFLRHSSERPHMSIDLGEPAKPLHDEVKKERGDESVADDGKNNETKPRKKGKR